jgi:hypothetical protein
MYAGATMTTEYRIEPDGAEFILIDNEGETVGVYPAIEAAKQVIERCKKDDAMWETAKLLLDTAIKANMQMHGVDRETARCWVTSAGEAAD